MPCGNPCCSDAVDHFGWDCVPVHRAWVGTPLCWAPPSNQWTGGELGLSHWRARDWVAHVCARDTHVASWCGCGQSFILVGYHRAERRQARVFRLKAEVSSWPGIGFLANITGTVFIRRERRDSKLQKDLFQTRLGLGHKLLFFPEGTSTDSLRVLPFKSTLFAAFFEPELKDKIYIQAVTVNYHAPKNQDKRFYGWWGEMDFGTHMIQSLSALPQGHVEVVFHEPRALKEYDSRKVLAADLEQDVRSAHDFDGKY